MDFVKKHKIKLVLLGVFVLVFIIALFALIALLYPDSRKDIYGNRLAGIKDVKISNQDITEIKDKINSSKLVNDIDYDLKGRLINFIIEVKETTKSEDAKKLSDNILEVFDEKTENYYDIEIIILSEKENTKGYPMFGYKHKTSKNFVWAKN